MENNNVIDEIDGVELDADEKLENESFENGDCRTTVSPSESEKRTDSEQKEGGNWPNFIDTGSTVMKVFNYLKNTSHSASPASLSEEAIRAKAKSLSSDIIHWYVYSKDRKLNGRDTCESTLRRATVLLIQKHRLVFTSMLRHLELNERNYHKSLNSVLTEMLADGSLNWGRLVAVYAFGCCSAEYCKNKGFSKEVIDGIAENIGGFIATEFSSYIIENNGWDGFCEYFKEEGTPEKVIWRGLLYSIATLGAFATTAAMAAR